MRCLRGAKVRRKFICSRANAKVAFDGFGVSSQIFPEMANFEQQFFVLFFLNEKHQGGAYDYEVVFISVLWMVSSES